ncbi:MAG: hypothetical protein PUP92_31105 [Rhizonema sp. PD38]|nr:hypothetical protein [Rhizonema sp. PD38]
MNYIKRFPFSLSLSVAFSTVMLCQASLPVQAQRGNQSDVTGAIVTTSDIKGPFFSPTPQRGRGGVVRFNSNGLRRVASEASIKVIDQLNLNSLTSVSGRPIPSQTQQSLLRILLASRSTEVTPTSQQITKALSGVQGGPTVQQAEQLVDSLQGLLKNFRLTTTIRLQAEVRYRRISATRLLVALNAYNNIIDRSSAQYLSNPPSELLAIRSVLTQITDSIRTSKDRL